jgi:hypothetical protein
MAGLWFRSGVRREALGADPVLGPGSPLPAPAPAQPLPHGALRAPLPARAAPPQLPRPAARRLPGERDHRVLHHQCAMFVVPMLMPVLM